MLICFVGELKSVIIIIFSIVIYSFSCERPNVAVTVIVLILPGESNGTETEIGLQTAFCGNGLMNAVVNGKLSGCCTEGYFSCRPSSNQLPSC